MYVLKGELKVVSIDRDSFKRLLGPLDEILKRNYLRYEKYLGWSKIFAIYSFIYFIIIKIYKYLIFNFKRLKCL